MSFVCTGCNRPCASKDSLNKHLPNCKGTPYDAIIQCHICNKPFPYQSRLRVHNKKPCKVKPLIKEELVIIEAKKKAQKEIIKAKMEAQMEIDNNKANLKAENKAKAKPKKKVINNTNTINSNNTNNNTNNDNRIDNRAIAITNNYNICVNFITRNHLPPKSHTLEDFGDHIIKNVQAAERLKISSKYELDDLMEYMINRGCININTYIFFFSVIDEIFGITKSQEVKQLNYDKDIYPELKQMLLTDFNLTEIYLKGNYAYIKKLFLKKIPVRMHDGRPVKDDFHNHFSSYSQPKDKLVNIKDMKE
jgi:hypothetical protein